MAGDSAAHAATPATADRCFDHVTGPVRPFAAGECVVCASKLPSPSTARFGVRDPYPVCRAAGCQMVVAKRSVLDEPAFRRYLKLQAQLHVDRRRALQMQARRVEERTALESCENDAIWASAHAFVPPGSAGRYLQLVLPSGPRRRIKLSTRRRNAYRDHLLRILAEIAAAPEAGTTPAGREVDHVPPTTLAGRICGMCGGGCCASGGDTAYLSADTIRRFMSQERRLSPTEILAAYFGRLEVRTEAGSCINHTARGCGLPREMRSDICNNYACESLSELQRAQREARAFDGVIAIRRRQNQWARGTLFDSNEITGVAVVTASGTVALPLRERSGPLSAARQTLCQVA